MMRSLKAPLESLELFFHPLAQGRASKKDLSRSQDVEEIKLKILTAGVQRTRFSIRTPVPE